MLVRNVFPLKPLVILPLYFVLSIPCDAQKGYFLKAGIRGSFAWGNLSMMS
jgi:hypothetical protein